MKEYMYRDYLRKPLKSLIWVIIYVFCIFFISGVISYIEVNNDVKDKFIVEYLCIFGIVCGIILSVYAIVYIFYLRNLKYKKFILGANHLIYKYKGIAKLYPYKDIIAIETMPIMKKLGAINIKFKDKSFKISVKIKNSNLFIKEIKEKLDAAGLSNKYNEKKLLDCYRNASYSDDSWIRMHDLSLLLPPTLGICIILAFICSFLTNDIGVKLIIVILLFIYPIIILLFSELYLSLQYAYNISKENFTIIDRDEDKDRKVYKVVAVILFIMLVTAITILIKHY